MHISRRSFSKIPTESFLIGILYLIGLFCLCNDNDKKLGHPFVYPTSVMLRCRVVMIWMRIPSNNCLHQYLERNMPYNRKVRACGLHALPDRRTFDRRFKVLPMEHIVSATGNRFVEEGLADCTVASVDSSLVSAKGRVWHRSEMISGTVRPGTDTDARWGFSKSKGWVFGYKMHLSCSTGYLVVPLSCCISTANVQDNLMYYDIVEPLPESLRYVPADLGYDDQKLYDFTRERGAMLVCPIRRRRHTKKKRLELIRFYRSRKGWKIYRKRSASIEPLFDCIKETFGVTVAPARGFENVSSYLLSCVFVYQMAIYYNRVTDNDRPRCVRHMLGN